MRRQYRGEGYNPHQEVGGRCTAFFGLVRRQTGQLVGRFCGPSVIVKIFFLQK